MTPSRLSFRTASGGFRRWAQWRWIAIVLVLIALAGIGDFRSTSATTPARLVKDIDPTHSTYSSSGSVLVPYGLVSTGKRIFFVQESRRDGPELWTSDGTTAGTRLVRDLIPGSEGVFILKMIAIKEEVFFVAQRSYDNQVALWKSDGTAAGTILLVGPQVGEAWEIGNLTNVDGTLFFTISKSYNQPSLWKSDGTPAGTVELKELGDLFPGEVAMASTNGKLFFVANDTIYGRELWTSDGTSAGTQMVKDLNPSGDAFNQGVQPGLMAVGAKLFLIATDGAGFTLWQTDGTDGGTTRVTTTDPAVRIGASELASANGKLFFRSSRKENGEMGKVKSFATLWISDGTPTGTQQIAELGEESPYTPIVLGFVSTGSRVFFQGFDRGLWTSNGTNSGTLKVSDVQRLEYGNSVAIGNTLFFVGKDASGDTELWKSDGTSSGTVRVVNLHPTSSSSPEYLAAVGNRVLFSANNGQGKALWSSDGTVDGTTLVYRGIEANGMSGDGQYKPLNYQMTSVGERVFFVANDGTHGYEVWGSDGSAEGTQLSKDIAPTDSSWPIDLTNLNGTLFFVSRSAPYINATSRGLWRSDGSELGTTMVMSQAQSLTNVNGTLFFVAKAASGYMLWKSDGTAAGTTQVAPLPAYGSLPPNCLMAVGNRLFFVTGDFMSGRELWTSDGTAEGTRMVKDISNVAQGADPFALTDVNGTLFFIVGNEYLGYELWRSDGTESGTVRLQSFKTRTNQSSAPGNLTAVDDRLFFTAFDLAKGKELWVSDGTEDGTRLVKDINTSRPVQPYDHNGNATPQSLANVNGVLLFSADDGLHGRELWRSDGTEGGTTMVKDINPGLIGSAVSGIQQVRDDGWAIFAASNGVNGIEVWKTDGTSERTEQLQDIAPGASSSNPHAFTLAGTQVFFVANDSTTGSELWVLNASSVGAAPSFRAYLPLVPKP